MAQYYGFNQRRHTGYHHAESKRYRQRDSKLYDLQWSEPWLSWSCQLALLHQCAQWRRHLRFKLYSNGDLHAGSNYSGNDNFTYKVNDGSHDSNMATVAIAVTSVNDAPVANGQSVITNEDTTAPSC